MPQIVNIVRVKNITANHIAIFIGLLSVISAYLLIDFGTLCFAKEHPEGKILDYGLSATTKHNPESAFLFKNALLKEAKEGKFMGPSHSMKIKQTWAMFRGYYYLESIKLYPKLFSDHECDIITDWFVRITERAFTVEWSDIYYALVFRKPVTAPYRNQENGTGALVVYAEIIKNRRPDLAEKALDYVEKNAVMWEKNFRNTDDSISYQSLWIYNCYNVARLLHPEWLKNDFSRKSFDWLKNQWPPDGSPLGYNPNPCFLVPDIMYLGAHLHKDGTYKWLGDKMLGYAFKHKKNISGFRPGLALKNDYFAVFDFNSGKKRKKHAISWHLRGELFREDNRLDLRQENRELSLYLCSDDLNFTVQNSGEQYRPENKDFEAFYDVWMQSDCNYSEMISLFFPKRGNAVHLVEKPEESNPYMMCLKINTEKFRDTILIRGGNSVGPLTFNNLRFDSDYIVLREKSEKTKIYYRGGSFVTLNGKKFYLKHEQGELIISNKLDLHDVLS